MEKDIWRFSSWVPDSPGSEHRIAYTMRQSPLLQIESDITGPCILKREDLNRLGSHKERAAIFQVSKMRESRQNLVTLSSSGNAGIAISHFAGQCGIDAFVFMSEKSNGGKVKRILQNDAAVFMTPKPINFCNYVSRMFSIPNLKPSTDRNAVLGFMNLGFEIYEQFPTSPPPAIFIYSTSGASLLGIAKAFYHIVEIKKLWRESPALHAVQAGKSVALAEALDTRVETGITATQAGFGGVRKSRLFKKLHEHVMHTNGSAWRIFQDEIRFCESLLENLSIETSSEGAAAMYAVHRWRREGGTGVPLVILTGQRYPQNAIEPDPRLLYPSGYLDLKKMMEKHIKGTE